MHKFLILFLVLLLSAVMQATGQDTLSFYDDFQDNRNNWNTADEVKISTQIRDGNYLFENKDSASASWVFRNISPDPTKDFVIESRITQTKGAINEGYGLVWGLDKGDNYCSFQITANGYFKVYEYIGGKYNEIKTWTLCAAIQGITKANKLRIEKKNQTQIFYINDTKVFTTFYSYSSGAYLAFLAGKKNGMAIDYLKIEQHTPPPINLVKNLTSGYKKENLGTNINSAYFEKSPLIAPDGKTLYVTRNSHPGNIQGSVNDDIWVSSLSTDKQWQVLQNIGAPLNNIDNNFIISVTPDNNTLLLGNQYNTNGTLKGGGYSISHRNDNGWCVPADVVMKNYVNKSLYTSSCLANNGKAIIISIEADSGYGSNDLHVSFQQENGEWSQPKNLGPIVNTFAADETPFLAADGVTLYYSTNGKSGYGSNDIFKTTRLDETWTNWSEPENLGSEINTPGWDAYFTIPASGEYALMASYENSLGALDIFKINLPEGVKPKPVVLVYGKVLNSQTKQVLQADIAYHELASNKQLGIAHATAKEGTYKIVLPAGGVYSFLASKDSYYAVSENIDLSKLTQYKEIEKDLYLSPIEVGATVRLNNIFFDTGKATLKEESFPELERVIKFLNENKGIEIELSGHTDDVGTGEDNKKLSGQRATAVYSFLVSKGIITGRLQALGYGETKPVASNETLAGKQLNRRVEFTITKK